MEWLTQEIGNMLLSTGASCFYGLCGKTRVETELKKKGMSCE